MLHYPRQLETEQEEIASNRTRGGSGWTPGRISPLKGGLALKWAAQGSGGVTIPAVFKK